MRSSKSSRAIFRCGLIGAASLFAGGTMAFAAPIIIDDFDVSEGHFNSTNPATASGTNRHITSATADLSSTFAFTGTGSEYVTVIPQNPGTSTDFPTDQFRLRFLSGGGTPANNVNIGPNGYVGYFVRTTTEGLFTAPGLDDGTALELGVYVPVIADGAWHLYQFNLNNPDEWDPFAGTGQNGTIDGPTVTIDSIFFRGPTSIPGGAPVEFYLDTVAYNPTGDLTALVPEPGSIALLSIAALGLMVRRKR